MLKDIEEQAKQDHLKAERKRLDDEARKHKMDEAGLKTAEEKAKSGEDSSTTASSQAGAEKGMKRALSPTRFTQPEEMNSPELQRFIRLQKLEEVRLEKELKRARAAEVMKRTAALRQRLAQLNGADAPPATPEGSPDPAMPPKSTSTEPKSFEPTEPQSSKPTELQSPKATQPKSCPQQTGLPRFIEARR